ncbi:hypothetical protein RGQ29_013597 [Quercus rubra]|uniref:Endonuclease/exonuclease/phosphatase domain-containing protein n=1 Tax=Quercus rubra TaxID=3512 RepID=A0AAN7J2A0_QUERU|nr:hypothetical protein RGQ29_013597 [Quercus rubra]
MNILVWNYRGAMKPEFRKTVMDLVAWHDPILMVITETRLSGAIGFVGGIWMLWRANRIQVDVLTTTEQEIHALIQVRAHTFNWLISAIYANPRFAERCVLWENLKILASLHNLP